MASESADCAGLADVVMSKFDPVRRPADRGRARACVGGGDRAVHHGPLNSPEMREGREVGELYLRGDDWKFRASGRIELDSAGRNVRLLSRGDPDTRDAMGNSGDGRSYYVGSFRITGSCWEFGPTDVCYPGCEGLTIYYSFVLVPDDALRELEFRADGVSASDLRRLNVERVGEFAVPVQG